jgi:DNA invertase Pin-like site-specific DNA recombinase
LIEKVGTLFKADLSEERFHMLIGYARVSTKDQDRALQLDALKAAGCGKIFEETASGAKRDREQLAAALEFMREGDCLVVWKVDRLARSLSHLIAIAEDLKSRGIHFKSLTENFDTTTASGEAFFQICGVMAQLERKLIEERREAGLAKARASGKKFGRKPADDPTAKEDKSGRLAKAMQMIARGSSIASAAKANKIGRATLHRHITAQGRDTGIVPGQLLSDMVSGRKTALNGHAEAR